VILRKIASMILEWSLLTKEEVADQWLAWARNWKEADCRHS
jgi:hypothetical protein